RLDMAGAAPVCPEIQQHESARVTGKLDGVAVNGIGMKTGRRLALRQFGSIRHCLVCGSQLEMAAERIDPEGVACLADIDVLVQNTEALGRFARLSALAVAVEIEPERVVGVVVFSGMAVELEGHNLPVGTNLAAAHRFGMPDAGRIRGI